MLYTEIELCFITITACHLLLVILLCRHNPISIFSLDIHYMLAYDECAHGFLDYK